MQYFSEHPELNIVEGAMEYVTTPQKKNADGTPEKMFSVNTFGENLLLNFSRHVILMTKGCDSPIIFFCTISYHLLYLYREVEFFMES